MQLWPNFFKGEIGCDKAHAAVDVKSDASGRDDAAVHVKCGDAADGESVAAVPVGHAQGGCDDAGKAGNVGELVKDGKVHVFEEFFAGKDAGRDAHSFFVAGRDVPYVWAFFLKVWQGDVAVYHFRCQGRFVFSILRFFRLYNSVW